MKHMFDDIFVIAGNVATLDGFNDLADAGADAIRVGIGGGSVCSTRIVTGHGVPTLQSVVDCSNSDRDCYIIADGGIRNSGDIVKSFGAGADFVMLGSMLAGKEESPGETRSVDGVKYKNYRGRVSVAEGVDSWRPVNGTIGQTIDTIVAGVKSGLSYSGCDSLAEFCTTAEFVRITSASMKESVPHATGVVF
jgi:IMP dehydrogenase